MNGPRYVKICSFFNGFGDDEFREKLFGVWKIFHVVEGQRTFGEKSGVVPLIFFAGCEEILCSKSDLQFIIVNKYILLP